MDLTKGFALEGVLATVTVGNAPFDIAYNPGNGNMYVANLKSGTVSVIDQNNDVVDTVMVGDFPNAIAYNPGNGNMYVANYGSTTVSVIGATSLPISNAGPNQTPYSGDTVHLDGSGSSDPSGSILTYQWTQTQGPEVFLDDSTAVNPMFTAPNVLLQSSLVFELVVTNEQGIASQPDSVTITVNPSNEPPSFEEILGSGNNINIQVQENSRNNVGSQSGGDNGNMYSDSPIHQRQSTNQDSSVTG